MQKAKPSPATVIALVALFFSLAGVGIAAGVQPTRDLRAEHSLQVIQHDLRKLLFATTETPSYATSMGHLLDAEAQNAYAVCLNTQQHPRNTAAYCQRWTR